MIEACKHSRITNLFNNPNAELRLLYFRGLQEQIDTTHFDVMLSYHHKGYIYIYLQSLWKGVE